MIFLHEVRTLKALQTGIERALSKYLFYGQLGVRKGQYTKNIESGSWNLSDLQEFLADRGINKTGNKDTFVTNAYNAYKMNIEISATDYIEEKNEVEPDLYWF